MNTFEEWLAYPALGFERRWVYGLKDLYKQFVIERSMAPERLIGAGSGKLMEVLPAVRRGLVSADEAISDAQSLSSGDLRIRYRGLLGSPQQRAEAARGASWDATDEPAYAICPQCGSRYRDQGGMMPPKKMPGKLFEDWSGEVGHGGLDPRQAPPVPGRRGPGGS